MAQTFTDLFFLLGDTSSSSSKVELLASYLGAISDEEFPLAVHLLQGGVIKTGVRPAQLRAWAGELAGVQEWLVDECYSVVGDLAETAALLVSGASHGERNARPTTPSLIEWVRAIEPLASSPADERKRVVLEQWSGLAYSELLVFNKLITGGLRIGISKGVVAKALSEAMRTPYEQIRQRLVGSADSRSISRAMLVNACASAPSIAPYPFFLAYPLEKQELAACGHLHDWQAEWKWDGIRAQIVKRSGEVAIWSRGEEMVSESFPEIVEQAQIIPDGCVLDGEIVAWKDNHPGSFFDLQKRIHRRRVTSAIIRAVPTRFLAYDLLENQGIDIRQQSLSARRRQLEYLYSATLTSTTVMSLPEPLQLSSWSELTGMQKQARDFHAEGLMLKRLDSEYGVGRTRRGAWWKWKVEPYSIDAALVYAQKGHGRRADLFTDYTFAVWDGESLVTFAKAYSGLRDSELVEVDAFIKRNTRERFGPVRTVSPELVFEIAFESIQISQRHRSGVAVRFPRIVRWRRDKSSKEADTIETLRALTRP
jgi:DNA ligase-1